MPRSSIRASTVPTKRRQQRVSLDIPKDRDDAEITADGRHVNLTNLRLFDVLLFFAPWRLCVIDRISCMRTR